MNFSDIFFQMWINNQKIGKKRGEAGEERLLQRLIKREK